LATSPQARRFTFYEDSTTMGSSQSSTQAIIDHGIQSEHDEDTIVQYLNINDPKLEAIIRAYIHVRRENTETKLSRWRDRNQYCCF